MNGRDDNAHVLEELCRRLTLSDEEAFERVFRILRDELVRYVRSIVRQDAVAHDVVQDVFISLWDMRRTLDPSLSLKALVYRMARNASYRHVRDVRTHSEKHALMQREAEQDARNGSQRDGNVDADLLARQIGRWIDELPERQREALLLSRYHDLSHREIASVMDISPRTVNNHIMRALRYLHDRMQHFEPAFLKQ